MDSSVASVVQAVRDAADAIGLTGQLYLFGSYVNGFSTGNSDCDLSYMPPEGKESQETPVWVLQRFASELPKHGFTGIITIFQAIIPLIKAIDPTGKEVDLCVGNRLGMHNSKLIAAYYALDPRVGEVGKMVKKWAKAYELVGSSDGHLNSYAYTLLTIYYLMHTEPPVVPNLQDLAVQTCDPEIVRDSRWGRENVWDCKFWSDIHLVPKSANRMTVEELLAGFFEYYTSSQNFNWADEAVSIRLARTPAHLPGSTRPQSKFSLMASSQVTKEQWYVEDPFDLRHNLASQCTKDGRERIMKKMQETRTALADKTGERVKTAFQTLCSEASASLPQYNTSESSGSKVPARYMLKCRIHTEKVNSKEFAQTLSTVWDVEAPFVARFPASRAQVAEAFLLFAKESDRRKVHRLNETYVGEWQLRLLPCCSWALKDALNGGTYEELEINPKQPSQEAAAEDLGGEQYEAKAREEVRVGLKVATQESEIRVLMQRAQALGLQQEEQTAKNRLRQMPGMGKVPFESPPPDLKEVKEAKEAKEAREAKEAQEAKEAEEAKEAAADAASAKPAESSDGAAEPSGSGAEDSSKEEPVRFQ